MIDQPKTPTRVGFLTNSYAPYKEAMFRELVRLVDLKVYYTNYREAHRDWTVDFTHSYPFEFLRGWLRGTRSRDGLRAALIRNQIELIFIGGYFSPTLIYAPFLCDRLGIAKILWSGSTRNERSCIRATLPFVSTYKRLLFKRYDGFVAYTSKASEYLRELGAPEDRITVAPVTVDTDFFGPVSRNQ